MRRGGDVALAFALGLALAASVVPGGAGCGGGGSGNGSSPGSDASTPPGDGGGVSDGQGTSADGPGGGGSDGSAPANDGPGSSGDSASAFDVGPITGLNGATYFVDDAKGSDANPGTATAPWKTLQKAGDTVKGGDTVTVRAGTYDGAIFGWDGPAPCGDTDCTITGTAAHPILLQADPAAAAGKVVIASKNKRTAIGLSFVGCDYVFVRGFTVTNGGTAATPAGSITKAGIAVAKSTGNRLDANLVDGVAGIGGILVDLGTNVLVTGNEVRNVQGTNTTGHGMYVSGGSTGVQVLDNAIHDNGYVGLHVNGDASEGAPGVVTNLLVAGNRIYENGQNGINADGLQGSRIENNVLYANARNGIELLPDRRLGRQHGQRHRERLDRPVHGGVRLRHRAGRRQHRQRRVRRRPARRSGADERGLGRQPRDQHEPDGRDRGLRRPGEGRLHARARRAGAGDGRRDLRRQERPGRPRRGVRHRRVRLRPLTGAPQRRRPLTWAPKRLRSAPLALALRECQGLRPPRGGRPRG